MLPLAAALLLASQPPRPDVDRERLMETLRALPTSRAALGGPDSVAGLEQTQALIVDRLKALGYEPRLEPVRWALPARTWPQPHTPADGSGAAPPPREVPAPGIPPRLWNNVIVDLPGIASPDQVLLVGAHYDAVPGAPGADDNGTGVAALLELARVFKGRPLNRTVRLAFFTLEEVGLVGSRVHAAEYASAPDAAPADPQPPKLVGMISLEMLGYFSDAPGSQRSPVKPIKGVFTPPTVGDSMVLVTVSGYSPFCRRVAAAMEKGAPGLKVFPFDVLPLPVPDMLRSDHAPFLAAGVPALMFTDTAEYRNPNYHKPTDTIETIDVPRFTLAVRGLASAVEEVATSNDPPVPHDEKAPGAQGAGR